MHSTPLKIITGVLATLAIAPAAQAASVGRSGGSDDPYQPGNDMLFYTGSSASSQLTVTEESGGHRFHDSGDAITAFPGCSTEDAHTVFCHDHVGGVSGKITKIYIYGNGGNDSITSYASIPTDMDGGPGQDSLRDGSSGDSLYGGPGDDDLHGNGGYDTLSGDGGYDTLDGGTEGDKLDGGTENDTLDGGAGADTINGGTGNDTVDYSIRQNGVTVDLDGSAGDDGAPGEDDSVGLDVENINGGKGSDTLTGNAYPNFIRGGSGVDHIYGGEGGDTLYGDAADDTLKGEGGNDQLYGGIGNDTLTGGEGDEYLDGGTGSDAIDGGAGQDGVVYSTRTAPVNVSLDDVKNDGEAGELDNVASNVEYVTGGEGNDTLTGDAHDNMLFGDGGKDTLDGGAGKDYLAAGPGDDILRSRDDEADTNSCNLGVDTVTADAKDTQKACENVDLPKPPPVVDPGTGQTGQTGQKGTKGTKGKTTGGTAKAGKAAGPVLLLGPGRVRLTTTRFAVVRVHCPRKATATCRGTLRLVRGGKVLGRHAFAVKAGRTAKVRVRISRASAAKLRHTRRGLRIAARATAHSGASRNRLSKRTLTLLRSRPHRAHR